MEGHIFLPAMRDPGYGQYMYVADAEGPWLWPVRVEGVRVDGCGQ